MDAPLTLDQLFGIDAGHVLALPAAWSLAPARLHADAAAAFAALRDDAAAAGFDLRVASGFRDFARQLAIWNAKARGERAVLDATEQPLDVLALDARDRLFAILRWSALPGASRHHWGSDLDLIDAAAVAPGYQVQLTVAETLAGGPFAAMHRWLDERIAGGRSHGFFRPYRGRGCEVAAEPWHLSYAPLAAACQCAFDPVALMGVLRTAGVELCAAVAANLDEVLQRYAWVPGACYPPAWCARIEAAAWNPGEHR